LRRNTFQRQGKSSHPSLPLKPIKLTTPQFDDLKGNLVPADNPVNAFGGLLYSGFVFFAPSPASVLKTPSKDNVITFGPLSKIQYGPPIFATTLDVDTFTLKRLRYACAINTEVPLIGAPVGCTITLKGLRKDETEVERSLLFVPKLDLKLRSDYATATEADLIEFTDLLKVDVSIFQDVDDQVKVPLFDDLQYNACILPQNGDR
jgi:hypothetical protein